MNVVRPGPPLPPLHAVTPINYPTPSERKPVKESHEQRIAAAEALKAFQEASEQMRRTRIFAVPDPTNNKAIDVTEEVVSLLDMITTSMDWGSDFWSDADFPSFITLCRLLNFDSAFIPEMHPERPPGDLGVADGSTATGAF